MVEGEGVRVVQVGVEVEVLVLLRSLLGEVSLLLVVEG